MKFVDEVIDVLIGVFVDYIFLSILLFIPYIVLLFTANVEPLELLTYMLWNITGIVVIKTTISFIFK